jgi:ribose/xylose/arabinose/galactoside ABC-type transport system permease subunit
MPDVQVDSLNGGLPQNSPVKTRGKNLNPGALTIVILTGGLFLLLSFTSDTFFTYRNIYTIFYGVSIEFFAVIGFTYLLIMGEVDLSIGSVYCFSGVMVGYLMMIDVPLFPALLISLACCTCFGLITGLLVTKFKANSLMVTIGSMTLIRGLAWLLTGSMAGSTFDRAFRSLARDRIGSINTTVIVFILLAIILEVALRRASFFKKIFYIGENLDTARIYGINADRIKISIFAISSFTAAIGGILIASRITHADVTTGIGLEFKMLTAAILGGASLFGGKGSILRSIVGLIFLAAILNGMIIFNIEPLLQQFVVGVILIISVFVDTRLNRERVS